MMTMSSQETARDGHEGKSALTTKRLNPSLFQHPNTARLYLLGRKR